MNFAAVLVGVSLGQPPAATPASDYYPLASRTIKLPIKYEKDRKGIRQVKLYVARNGENTWYQESAVPPDRDAFTFIAKEDGIYWFTMVEEDLQGKNLPADLTRTPPDLKVLVDTIQPRIQFASAKRSGEEVVVEWLVDDRNPDENKTQVHFRAAGSEDYWQEVTLPTGSKSGVRFAAGTSSPVVVRVTATDVASNRSEATREVNGNGPPTTTTTSMSPRMSGPPTTPVTPSAGVGTPIPPPDSLAPVAPTGPAPVMPPPVGTSPPTPASSGAASPPAAVQPPAAADSRLPRSGGARRPSRSGPGIRRRLRRPWK